MLIKLFFVSVFILTGLIAKVDISVTLIKSGSSYILENDDIVFKDDKLKFNIKSDTDEDIEIMYKTRDSDYKLLKNIELKKGITINFPKENDYIVLDEESGSLSFLFKTKTFQKEIRLNTNPSIKSINEKTENIDSKDSRIYIDRSKIISNDRGEKESNIIIPKLESSTVIVKVENSIGAGVIIEKGKYILTNYHVVEPNTNDVYIAFKPKLGTKPSNNNYYKVTVEKVDMSKDLALLKMPDNINENLKFSYLKFADENQLKKGMDIYNIGHPLGYYFAFEYGMLTNILNDYSWDEYKADYILQYSMNSNKGNSGSPIVNDKLELIGIGAFTNKKGENLNFGISIIDIKNFISQKESVIVEKKNPNEYKDKIIEQGLYQNIKMAKIDRNNNGIPDAMMKDIDNDGNWDIIAYDSNEDGVFERKTSYK